MAFLRGVGEGTELPALPRRSTTSTAIASATVTITGTTKRSKKAAVSKKEKQTKKAAKKKTKRTRPADGHDSSRDSPWVCVEGVPVHATYFDLLSFFDADSAGPARSIDATFTMGHYTDPSDPRGVADSDAADAPAMVTDVYVVFLTADAAANAALYDGNAFRGPAVGGDGGVRVNVNMNMNVRLVGAKEATIAKALGLAWGGAGGTAGGCTDSPAILRQELLTAGVSCSLLNVRAGGGGTGLLACVNHVLGGCDPTGHGLTPAAIQGRGTRAHASRAGLLKGYGRLYGRRHTEGSRSTGLTSVPWAVAAPPPPPAAAASMIKAPAAQLLFRAGGGAELLTSIVDITESLTGTWAALVLEPQSIPVCRARHWASRALCLMHLLHVALMGHTSLTEAF
jgi:hypothetical protein